MSLQNSYTPKITMPNNTTDDLGKEVITLEHNFLESGLFSDEKLADLIENYPREYYLLTTMTEQGSTRAGQTTKQQWFQGDINNLSGKQVLEAVRKGRFWLQIRRMDLHAPEYQNLVNKGLEQVGQMNPHMKSTKHSPSLLISSPMARVLFHVDMGLNVLWHMRGQKRVWLYEAENETQFSEEDLEGIVLGETEEDMLFDPEWDTEAQSIILQPGQALTWPFLSPHRVDNLDEMNVSIASDFLNAHVRKRLRVAYANGILRRKMGKMPVSSQQQNGLVAMTKSLAGVVAKKSKLYPVKSPDRMLSFKLDPDNIGNIIHIPKKEQTKIVQL